MVSPNYYEEAMQSASDELAAMAHRGLDYAMSAVWTVMRSYDDDEFWDDDS